MSLMSVVLKDVIKLGAKGDEFRRWGDGQLYFYIINSAMISKESITR